MHTLRLFFLFILPVSLLSCASSGSESADERERISYEETRTALYEKEINNPPSFLTASADNKKNLIGQTVIKGKISNSATIAVFKDIAIQLSFYSATGTLLETDKETLYLEVGPGQSKSFKTKYFAPKGTDSVAISVTGAQGIQ